MKCKMNNNNLIERIKNPKENLLKNNFLKDRKKNIMEVLAKASKSLRNIQSKTSKTKNLKTEIIQK
jgi:hypothetical protein